MSVPTRVLQTAVGEVLQPTLTDAAAHCEQDHGQQPGRWHYVDGELVCVHCAVPWPGVPLPTPTGRNDGYGNLADQPRWHTRVGAMVDGLRELD